MSRELLDLAVLERKKYNDLNEVLDLTQQLGEALDRNDQVSARMLIAMRQDPILHLEEVDRTAKARRETLSPEDQDRLAALQAGSPPRDDGERTYLEQSGRARSLLERVVELDRRISLRMAGNSSFYYQEKK